MSSDTSFGSTAAVGGSISDLAPAATRLRVDLRDAARVQADLADAQLAPGRPSGTRRRAVAVEHLHELDPPGPTGVAPRFASIATGRAAPGPVRPPARRVAGVVEEHVGEADRRP